MVISPLVKVSDSRTISRRHGTSTEIVSRMQKFGMVAANCSVIAFITGPVGLCGADFAAHIRKQYDDYGRVIGEAKIKAE